MAEKENTASVPAPVVTMTPQAALDRIRQDFPKEAEVFAGILKKDVVRLAEDEAFALRDKDGEIRAFKQALVLSATAGTLIQPVFNGPWVVSAQGYEHWQEAAGACVIFPSEVLVDGKWTSNPAVIRDEKNGRILMIYARAVAFRFSSKGIPMVSDWTTIYDTPSYRMIDLLGKAKDKPQAFKLLPEGMIPEEPGTWAKYPFDEATCLWMNTGHEEALKWLSSIINREKKSLDFAQTFAKRNALKHLSGIQKAPGPQWTISVTSWRPTSGNIIKWDATQYVALQNKVGSMISGDRSEFAHAQIEKLTGKERVSDDEAAGALIEMEIEPEDGGGAFVPPTAPEPAPEPEAAQTPPTAAPTGRTLSDEDKRILQNLEVTRQTFAEEYGQALKNLKLSADAVTNGKTAAAIMAEINRIVDSGNAG